MHLTGPPPTAAQVVVKTWVHEVKVMWGDCDPAGIVFFPNFARWMDAASQQILQQWGGPWSHWAQAHGVHGTQVVDIRTRFRHPASYGDTLQVHTALMEASDTLFVHHHVVKRGSHSLCSGYLTRVFVARDPVIEGTWRTVPIPPGVKTWWAAG